MGVGEPLPLPTTILGSILGTRSGKELGGEVLEALSNKFQCRIEALRGPYYPYGEDGVAIHLYPGRLLCIDGQGVIRKVIEKRRILMDYGGTALRRDAKVVQQGMLYRVLLLDPEALRREGVEPQVSIDMVSSGNCRRNNGVRKLGGDMRLAVIGQDTNARLLRLLKKITTDYYVLTSPLLLGEDRAADAKRLLNGECMNIDECKLCPPTVSEAKRIVEEVLVKAMRVKIEMLSPGVYGDSGFPRKPYLAILPGSLLKCKCHARRLEEGLGLYSRLGFGTLAPLRSVKHAGD